jgi:hypothetical protein
MLTPDFGTHSPTVHQSNRRAVVAVSLELAFGLKPILKIEPVHVTALDINLVRPPPDFH